LLPLTFATANNAYLEAHSLGIPTVVSNLPSVHDYATSQTLFFSGLQEAVHHLKTYQNMDRNVYLQIRHQIKEESKKFHWEAIARKVVDFYQEVYESGKPN
jgi:glycosyltransferase involved in cell wall biosynthesis